MRTIDPGAVVSAASTLSETAGSSISPGAVARQCLACAIAVAVATVLVQGLHFTVSAIDRVWFATTPPTIGDIDVRGLFIDTTPIALTTTAAWVKVPHVASVDALTRDHTLWLRMDVHDWDTVPDRVREAGLEAMLGRYGDLLANPWRWDHMSADDWDAVPQPMRALAFRHMAEYWSGYYAIGAAHGVARGRMANSLAALVMTESWFDHRAVNVNRWGNRDLGVAQASDGARERFRSLFRGGAVDVHLEDEDYFNPWKGTRFVALWMAQLLDELEGDLDAAVRGYHRGTARARRGEGQAYLETFRQRLHVFILNEGESPSWRYLWRRDRELLAHAWPWLAVPAHPLPARLETLPHSPRSSR